jgi:putative membrane protein
MLAHVGAAVLEPLQLAPALAAGVLYALRARTLARRGKPVEHWRQACWYGGLVVVVVALASPLGHAADELFLAHMAEHLLMADLAALLLVLGLTGPVLAPVLRSPLGRLRALAHPVAALGLWAANLVVWHVPALHELAVRDDAVHALQHLLLVGFGANVWMAVLGPLPTPAWFGDVARLVDVLVVRLIATALANVLVWAQRPLFDVYAPGWRSFGVDGLTDQVVAGSIMMVEGSVLTLCVLAWLFLRSGRRGEERQALLDLAARRGVALSEQRAARAVAAGRGGELRRRLEERPQIE